MKLINLSLHSDKRQNVYVNVEHIGYMIERDRYTTISIATNGEMNVTNSISEIIDLINGATNNGETAQSESEFLRRVYNGVHNTNY